jgi:hypothetical protein
LVYRWFTASKCFNDVTWNVRNRLEDVGSSQTSHQRPLWGRAVWVILQWIAATTCYDTMTVDLNPPYLNTTNLTQIMHAKGFVTKSLYIVSQFYDKLQVSEHWVPIIAMGKSTSIWVSSASWRECWPFNSLKISWSSSSM